MGKYEQAFFEKHFKSIERLVAFRKKFNTWEFSHMGKGIYLPFMGPIKLTFTDRGGWRNERGEKVQWVFLTKNKVDKEIARRQSNL